MDLPSTNWMREQSDSTDPQASSPAVQSADGATFERQLNEIANSDGGGGAMPAAPAPQPARSTPPPLYSGDASAIWGLEEALIKGGAAPHTAQNNAYSLLGFGRWLLANNKPAIVARLNDKSLIADARQFIEEGHPRAILTAIDHLRTSQSTGGVVPIAGFAELNPHSEDVALINKYKNEAATATARSNAVALRSFSDYLRKNNKEGIAARLSGTSLDRDVDAYKSHPGYNRKIRAALAHLRQPRDQSELHFYSEDAALFSGLEKALIKGGGAESTAKDYVRTLRSFGRWLFANNKQAIAVRHNDESLIADARQFIEEGHPRAVLTVIDHLRTSQSTGGVKPIAGRAELNPYHQDAALIEEYKDEETTETGKKVEIRKDATALRSFSHYLRENNKPGIAGRLSGKALDGDVKCYKKDAGGNRRIGAALARLRKSSAGAEAMELERHIDPEDAALRESRRVGDAAAQHSASQKAGSWPEELPAEGYDQDLGRMDEPGPSSSAPQPAQSTGIVIGQRKQPLYSEDAPLISGLERALIKGGFSKFAAELYPVSLRSFSRWLFAEKKPSIRARLDNQSLTDGSAVLEFTGQRNPKTLLQAIDYLRTFRSTGAVPISQRAKLNPPPQNVALINPEDAVLMDARRVDAATAQHRASETGSRPEELPAEGRDQDLLLGVMDEPGPSSSVEPAARHHGAPDPGASVRPLTWRQDRGQSPDELMGALARSNLPSEGDLIIPDYRMAERASSAEGPWHAEDDQAWSPLLSVEPEELRRLLDDEPMSSQPIYNSAELQDSGDLGDQLPGENLAELLETLASPRHSPADSVNQPGAAVPWPLQAVDPNGIWPEAEQAGQLPINDEHDPAELRPAKRPRTLDDLQGVGSERQLSAIGNSGDRLLTPAPIHQLGASPWEAQSMMPGSGYEDATAPHAAAIYLGDAAAQHSAPQGAVSWPLVFPEGYDQGLRLMVEDGPRGPGIPPQQVQDIVQTEGQEPGWSTSTTVEAELAHFAKARSDTDGGLEAAVRPDLPASFALGDTAWGPAPDVPPPFARPGPGHHHGARQLEAPQELAPIPVPLGEGALAWLTEQMAPEDPSARLSDIDRGFEAEVNPNPPAPFELRDIAHFAPMMHAARAPSDIYGGFPLVDLTAPTLSELRDVVDSGRAFPTTSNAQIGTLGPTASSSRSRLMLGDTQWLTDEHILRDYQLLEEELRRTNPNLAGRTQFVDPLVASQLSWGDTLSAFNDIVHDRQGHDTADFLFLPVNDADPTDLDRRGSHWSLLLVDRLNRHSPVAYHYDSSGSYNAGPASQLAERLGARLEWPRAPQQDNTYDCGVFVVDATRELVRQLTQRERPDLLNLDKLVVDRKALQNRLRG